MSFVNAVGLAVIGIVAVIFEAYFIAALFFGTKEIIRLLFKQ